MYRRRMFRMTVIPFALVGCIGQPSPLISPPLTPDNDPGVPPLARAEAGDPAPAPALAEIPFPAAALRDGIPAGTTTIYRIEETGKQPYLQHTTFATVSPEGCTFEVQNTALDGTPQGDKQRAAATWDQLESHAHFPRDRTTITEEPVDTPAGTFEAARYDIRRDHDGQTVTTRMWFARKLPGPPVKMEIWAGDTRTMFMVLEKRE